MAGPNAARLKTGLFYSFATRRAICDVRSVELLSQTMSCAVQPGRSNTRMASFKWTRVWARSFSSLKAGMMMEIFKPSLVLAGLGWLFLWRCDGSIRRRCSRRVGFLEKVVEDGEVTVNCPAGFGSSVALEFTKLIGRGPGLGADVADGEFPVH